MELSSLKGQTLKAFSIFECGPIDSVWVDRLTTSIVTWAAFLDLSESGLVEVRACEVPVEGKYPALGIELHQCRLGSLQASYGNGKTVDAQPLKDAAAYLPAQIISVVESDPLGEGPVSQYALILNNAKTIIMRHIMPPTMLGILIEETGPSPNQAFKPTFMKSHERGLT